MREWTSCKHLFDLIDTVRCSLSMLVETAMRQASAADTHVKLCSDCVQMKFGKVRQFLLDNNSDAGEKDGSLDKLFKIAGEKAVASFDLMAQSGTPLVEKIIMGEVISQEDVDVLSDYVKRHQDFALALSREKERGEMTNVAEAVLALAKLRVLKGTSDVIDAQRINAMKGHITALEKHIADETLFHGVCYPSEGKDAAAAQIIVLKDEAVAWIQTAQETMAQQTKSSALSSKNLSTATKVLKALGWPQTQLEESEFVKAMKGQKEGCKHVSATKLVALEGQVTEEQEMCCCSLSRLCLSVFSLSVSKRKCSCCMS